MLTDEQIKTLATDMTEYSCYGFVEFPNMEAVINFARAIEAACKPRGLPMKSAPRDGTKFIVIDRELEAAVAWFDAGDDGTYRLHWNHCSSWFDEERCYGWYPLPETEVE